MMISGQGRATTLREGRGGRGRERDRENQRVPAVCDVWRGLRLTLSQNWVNFPTMSTRSTRDRSEDSQWHPDREGMKRARDPEDRRP